ncbi:hypothetical protein M413DRAFT_444575 [Hebeloma cylindrosporum]|uniref:Uncharacterized protein n=1 Tax=Hebeloma cylindrosporum TaxID=76867 RepID=A0A0C3CEU3_HEBCY|nr:hypothetical protein M413DRAFT_444575 [Hebeloma cylindrosporum h7]
MASKSGTKGKSMYTKSDHQKQQLPVFQDGQFPPGFVPYEYVPFSQPSWQANAGVQGYYPQGHPPPNKLYGAPQTRNGYYSQPLVVGPRKRPPLVAPVIPRTPSPRYSPVMPDLEYRAPWLPEAITSEVKKRVIRPPSKEYLATKLVDNPLGLTNMIPREELVPREADVHTPWMWNPTGLKEDGPSMPPTPPTSRSIKEPEASNSKQKFRPRLMVTNHVVEPTPGDYDPMPQKTESRRTGSSSSVSLLSSSPIVRYSTSGESNFNVPPVVPLRSISNPKGGSPLSLSIPSRSTSQNRVPSQAQAIVPPHSASSVINATTTGATPKSRKSQPADFPSTSYNVDHQNKPAPDANQKNQLPWILASGQHHASKKPMDIQFLARMAGLRRQIDGTSSNSSTPQAKHTALLGSPVSIASTAFSQSFSVTSPPPAVEFPPTPVFTDHIPEGLKPWSVARSFEASALRKPSPLENFHPDAATQFLDTIHEVARHSTTSSSSNSTPQQQRTKLPASSSSVRRGYWNRRGDHLTPEGYLVLPPPSMQYPDDLKTYPFENEGYRDHSGVFTAYVRRPELPQSLPKNGNPPERPYESFVLFG